MSYLGRDPLGVEPPVTTNTAFSPTPSSSLARALTATEATPGYVSNKRENEATGPATWPADRRRGGREGAGRRRRLQSRKRARERSERTSPSSSSDACAIGERAEKSSERRETPPIAGATGNLLGDAFHWAGKNNARRGTSHKSNYSVLGHGRLTLISHLTSRFLYFPYLESTTASNHCIEASKESNHPATAFG